MCTGVRELKTSLRESPAALTSGQRFLIALLAQIAFNAIVFLLFISNWSNTFVTSESDAVIWGYYLCISLSQLNSNYWMPA